MRDTQSPLSWNLILRVALVALSLAAPGHAQQPASPVRRLTIEDALRWRIASNPIIAPDARRVAYLVSESDFEKSRTIAHLWWVDTETKQARRLTNTDAVVSDPRWSPDGRWVAFLAARGAAEGGKEPKPQVWLLAGDGGEAQQLTHAVEGVLHYRWAPDSKSIYYAAREPLSEAAKALREQREKQKRDAVVVDQEKFRREIWRIGVAEKKPERMYAGDLGLDSFETSPDGRWIVYRTNLTGDPDHDHRYNLWLLDVQSGAARQLTDREGMEHSPAWSPDSTRIAFLGPRAAEISYSQDEVFVVPITAQTQIPEPQRLTKSFAGQIERLVWPAKGNGIYFAAAVRTGNGLFVLDPTNGSVKPASPETGFLTALDCTADASACTALAEGPATLPEVVLVRPPSTTGEPVRLTDFSAQLKSFTLGAQEVVRWKSKDGLEIEGILIRPPGWQPGQRYPLLVDIHGGPFGRRANTLTTGNYPQVLAAMGWLVLQPNYRGSSAYGHEFGIANRGDLGGKDYDDILGGVDYAIAQGWADPKRLAVMGGSYGGYMTNWMISQTDRFQVAVSNFGIFNLISDFSNSIYPRWEVDYLKDYYWDNLQIYLDRSPMKYVKQIRTPVLIQHGREDPNTFISNSKELYQALKQMGRKVKYVEYPREGHGFVEPNHIATQFHTVEAWLDEHVPRAGERTVVAAEAVRSGPWELQVTSVRAPESYGGLAGKGRFVEVELLLRATSPTTERFSLLVLDNAGGDVSLSADGHLVYPEGLVTETLGTRLLVKSPGQVVTVVPDRDGNHGALAVAIAFDVPADARALLLQVKDFPAVRITLPMASKE
jgi:dipeptidyl aminopeptidase/acylaminoacyl peptidase